MIVEFRKIEVPVHNILHDRCVTGKCALRIDKVFRHVLMSEVTFVGISLFRLTSFNRTFTDYLTSVKEHSCLFVEELSCCYLGKMTVLIKLSYYLVRYLVVYLS